MQTITIAGLAARTAGEGQPLVLLHGGMGSWNHWTRNVDALASRFAVHLLDMPGYGDSPTVAKSTSDEDYAAMVIAAVNEIGGGRPLLLAGFSFGATIAAKVAASPTTRVGGLSLLGAGGFGRSPIALDLRQFPPESEGEQALRKVLRHNLGAMMIADPAKITDEAIDLHLANVRRTRFDGRHVSLSNMMPDALRRIACPVQMIWGDRDVLSYPDARARADTARAVRADLHVNLVPGAGHWVQFEAPEEVNRAMLQFFG